MVPSTEKVFWRHWTRYIYFKTELKLHQKTQCSKYIGCEMITFITGFL